VYDKVLFVKSPREERGHNCICSNYGTSKY